MIDAHYRYPRLVDIYDMNNPWAADTEFYLSLAEQSGLHILDLGCGTGTLCHGFADNGHLVTGVDPALAMLQFAEQKPNNNVQWQQATAQSYQSALRFDLIVMTGHVFQVLLTENDVMSALQTMRLQLKPNGIIAFESRNPTIDWAREWDTAPDTMHELSSSTVQQSINVTDASHGKISFQQSVFFADEVLHSNSTLRFMSATQVENCLVLAGFKIRKLYGDWDKSRFDQLRSREMIFVAELCPNGAAPAASC